jgi:hypothetical protein
MKLEHWLAIPNPEGSKKLRSKFAEKINVTPIMITLYCNGEAWPGPDKMAAIARETDGAVTANDFVDMQGVA